MPSSKADSVESYLDELPPERREVVSAVRSVILQNLPAGYRETMSWGMISYEVPKERFPDTYNGQPLVYAGLAAQKNHYSVHLNGVYQEPGKEEWLRGEFERAGKKLDSGKSCVRFRKLEALPLDVIGRVIAGTPVDRFLEQYESSRQAAAKEKPARRAAKESKG